MKASQIISCDACAGDNDISIAVQEVVYHIWLHLLSVTGFLCPFPAANVGPTPPVFPSTKVVWTHIPSDEGADVGCPARSGQHALDAPVDALVSAGALAIPDAKPIGTALTSLPPSPYQCRESAGSACQ